MANAFQYIANVGKSIGYSAIDTFKEMNPSLTEFAEQNAELGKVLYESVKDFKGTVRKAKDFVIQSQVGEFAIEYKKALFEDLKTGKFYNRERIDAMEARAAGGLFDNDDDPFAEIDGDWGGFDDSWDDQWDNFDEDKFLADSMDLTGSKVTQGVAMATARSAEYVVAANKQGLSKMQAHNEFLINKLNTGLSAINANMATQLKFNEEIMNKHVQNSEKFFTNTTAQLQTQTELLQKILDNQVKANGFMEQKEKEREKLNYEDITMNGMPDIKQYMKVIGRNASAESGGLGDMLNIFGGNTLLAWAGSPLKVLTDGLVKKAIPKIVKEATTSLNDSLSGLFASHLLNMDRLAEDDGPLALVGRLLGMNTRAKSKLDPSRYNKGPIPWDGESKMALTQVIPQLLSKILAAQTGTSERLFNYESGVWESAHDIVKSLKSDAIEKADSAKAFSELSQEMNKLVKMIDFRSAGKEKEVKKQLEEFYRSLYRGNGIADFTNAIKKDELNIFAAKNGLDSTTLSTIITPMMQNILQNNPSLAFKTNAALLDTRTSRRRSMENMQKNSNSTAMTMFRNFNENEFVNVDKETGEIILDINAITGKVKDKRNIKSASNNSLLFLKDAKGKTVFDYLDRIRWSLDDIRANGVYTYGGGYGGIGPAPISAYTRPNNNVDTFEEANSYLIESYKARENEQARKYKDNERYIKSKQEQKEYYRSKHGYTDKNYISGDFLDGESDEDVARALKASLERVREDEKHYGAWTKAKNKRGGFLAELLGSDNSKDLDEPSLFSKFLTKTNELMNAPVEFVANTIKRVDNRLFEIMFGDKEGMDTKSFIGEMLNKLTVTFNDFGDFLKEHILNPLKGEITSKGLSKAKQKAVQTLEKMGITKDSAIEFLRGQSLRYEEDILDSNGKVLHKKGEYILDDKGNKIRKGGMIGDFRDFKNILAHDVDKVYNKVKGYAGGTKDERIARLVAEYNLGNGMHDSLNEAMASAMQDPKYWEESAFNGADLFDENGFVRTDLRSGFKVKVKKDKQLDAKAIESYVKKQYPHFYDETGKPIKNSGYYQKLNELYKQAGIETDLSSRNARKVVRDEQTKEARAQADRFLRQHRPELFEDELTASFYGRDAQVLDSKAYGKEVAKIMAIKRKRLEKDTDSNIGNAYAGRMIDKTGVIAVSEGELVLPPEYNPFYKGKIDSVATRRYKENIAKSKFGKYIASLGGKIKGTIKGYAPGGSVDDFATLYGMSDDELQEYFDSASENGIAHISDRMAYKDDDPSLSYKVIDKAKGLYSSISNYVKEKAKPHVDKITEAIDKTAKQMEPKEDESERLWKSMVGDMKNNWTEYVAPALGGGLAGAGISMLTGLVGGPILGAAVGAGLSLTKNSEAVQNWLFGEVDENGNRKGNIITKDVANNIQKYFPDMAKGGTIGAITSILPFVPGGPVAGLVLGSAIGFAKNNDKFQTWLFGEVGDDGERDGGIISRKLRKELKGAIPAGVLGAIGGVGTSLIFGGPFGLMGNILAGSALGFASQTSEFQEWFFGTYNDKTGKKEGGALNAIKDGFVDPVIDFGKNFATKFYDWFKNDIADPISGSVQPLLKQGQIIMSSILGWATGGLSNLFHVNSLKMPWGSWIGDKVRGAGRLAGGILGTAATPIGAILSSPFRAVGAIGDYFNRRQIFNGNADYLSAAERNRRREEMDTGLRYKRYKSDVKDENGNIIHHKGSFMVDELGNYVRKSKRRFFKHSRRKDNFEAYDDFLQNADIKELEDVQGALEAIGNPDTYNNNLRKGAIGNIQKALIGVDYTTKKHILSSLRSDDVEGAIKALNRSNLDPSRKEELTRVIYSNFADIKAADDLSASGAAGRNKIYKRLKSLGFSNINDKNLSTYKNLIDKEVGTRHDSKSEIENLNDAQEKRHEKIVELFKDLINAVDGINNPQMRMATRQSAMNDLMGGRNSLLGGSDLRLTTEYVDGKPVQVGYKVNEDGSSTRYVLNPVTGRFESETGNDYMDTHVSAFEPVKQFAINTKNRFVGAVGKIGDAIGTGVGDFADWSWNGKSARNRGSRGYVSGAFSKAGHAILDPVGEYFDKKKKVRYVPTDDGRLVKHVRNAQGEWEIDESDAGNKDAQRKQSRDEFFGWAKEKITGLGDGILDKLSGILNINREQDGWLKKLGKIALGAGGVLTAAGVASRFEQNWPTYKEKLSGFWTEKIYPKIEQYIEPIKPTIARAAAGIDSAIRSIPSAIDGLATKIKTFFTETFPYVMTSKVAPFYRDGLNWLSDKAGIILETLTPVAIKGMASALWGVMKGTWQFMKNDIFTIFGGYGRRDAKSLMANTTSVKSSGKAVTAASDSTLGQKMSNFTGFSDFASKYLGATTTTSSTKPATAEQLIPYYEGDGSYIPLPQYDISNNQSNSSTPTVNGAMYTSQFLPSTPNLAAYEAYGEQAGISGASTELDPEVVKAYNEDVKNKTTAPMLGGLGNVTQKMLKMNGHNVGTVIGTDGRAYIVDNDTGIVYDDGGMTTNLSYDEETESITDSRGNILDFVKSNSFHDSIGGRLVGATTRQFIKGGTSKFATKLAKFGTKSKLGKTFVGRVIRAPFNTAGNIINATGNAGNTARKVAGVPTKGGFRNLDYILTKNSRAAFGNDQLFSVLTESRVNSSIAGYGKSMGAGLDTGTDYFANKLRNSADDVASKLGKKGINISSGVKDQAGNIINSIDNDALVKAADNYIDDLGKLASHSDDFGSKIAKKIKEFFENFTTNGTVKKAMKTALKDAGAEYTDEAVEVTLKKLGSEGTEALLRGFGGNIVKFGSKLGRFIPYINVAFYVADFVSGMTNAENILEITESGMDSLPIWTRFACGVANLINNNLTLGLIPLQTIVDLFIELLAPMMGIDTSAFLKIREESAKEVENYNKTRGLELSLEEYNDKDKWHVKSGYAIKSLFGDDMYTKLYHTNYGIGKKDTIDTDVYEKYNRKSASRVYAGGSSGIAGLFHKTPDRGLISQLDPMYAYLRFNDSQDTARQTIADSGCGPASAAMVINKILGNNVLSLPEAANYALAGDTKTKNGGVSVKYFNDIFKHNGLNTTYADTASDIKSMIKSINNPVVLLGKDETNSNKANSPFGPNNHYVVANGLSGDGKYIYINDPEQSRANIAYSSDILNNTTLAIGATTNTSNIKNIPNKYLEYAAAGSGIKDSFRGIGLRINKAKGSGINLSKFSGKGSGLKRYSAGESDIIEMPVEIAEGRSEYPTNEIITSIMVFEQSANIATVELNYNNTEEVAIGILKWTGSERDDILYKILVKNRNKAKKYLGGEKSTLYKAIETKKITAKNISSQGNITKLTNFLSTSESKQIQIESAGRTARRLLSSPVFTNVKSALFYLVMSHCNPDLAKILKSELNHDIGIANMINYIKDNYDLYEEKAQMYNVLYNYIASTPCTSLSEKNKFDSQLLLNLISISDISNTTEDNWMNNLFSGISRLIKLMLGISSDNVESIFNTDSSLSDGYSSTISLLGIDESVLKSNEGLIDLIKNETVFTFEQRFKNLMKLFNSDKTVAIYTFETCSLYSLLNEYGVIDDYNELNNESGSVDHILALKESYLKDYNRIIERFKSEILRRLGRPNYAESEDLKSIEYARELYKAQMDLFICYGQGRDLTVHNNLTASATTGGAFDNEYFYNRLSVIKNLMSKLKGKNRTIIVDSLKSYLEKNFDSDYNNDRLLNQNESERAKFADNINILASDIYTNSIKQIAWDDLQDYIFSGNSVEKDWAMRKLEANKNVFGIQHLIRNGKRDRRVTSNPYQTMNKTYQKDIDTLQQNLIDSAPQLITPEKLKYLAQMRFLYRTERLASLDNGGGLWSSPDFIKLKEGKYFIPKLVTYKQAQTASEHLRKQMAGIIGLPTDDRIQNPLGKEGSAFAQLKNHDINYRTSTYNDFLKYYELWKANPSNVGGPFTGGYKFNFRELANVSKLADENPNNENIQNYYNAHVMTANELLGKTTDKIANINKAKDIIEQSAMGSGFVSQFDYGNARFSDGTSLAEAGCGPAVASMALNNLSAGDSNMAMAAALADKYKDAGGTQAGYFQDIFGRAGAQTEYFDSNIRGNVKNSLKNGEQVVLMGRDASNTSKANSPFGPNNHYVLATGLGNGKLMISDPEQDAPSVYNESILNKTKLGVAVSGSGAALPTLSMRDKILRKINISGGFSNLSKNLSTIAAAGSSMAPDVSGTFNTNNAVLLAIYAIAQVESSGTFDAVNPSDGGSEKNPAAISVGCMQWYHTRAYNLINRIIDKIGDKNARGIFDKYGCSSFYNAIRSRRNNDPWSKGIPASGNQITALKELLGTNESKNVQLELLASEVYSAMANLKQYSDIKTRIVLTSVKWNRGNINDAISYGVTESTDYRTALDILQRNIPNGDRWTKTLQILNKSGSVTMPTSIPSANEVAKVFGVSVSDMATIFNTVNTSGDYTSSSSSSSTTTSSAKNWLDKLNDSIYKVGAKMLGLEVEETPEDVASKISTNAIDFGNAVVEMARYFVGKVQYDYGVRDAKNNVFDCSGFTQHVYKLLGVSIPGTASTQATITSSFAERITDIGSLGAGDLVFWKFDGDDSKDKLASHVGIYAGSGNVIHCEVGSGCVEEPMFGHSQFVYGIRLNPPSWGTSANTTVEYNEKLAMSEAYNDDKYLKSPSTNVASIQDGISAAGSGIRRSGSRRVSNSTLISNAISAAGSGAKAKSRRLPSMNDVMSGGIKFGSETSNSRKVSARGTSTIAGNDMVRPIIKSARRTSGGASSVGSEDKNLLETIIVLLGNIADNTSNVKDIVTLLSNIVNNESTSTTNKSKTTKPSSKNLGSVLSKHANSDRTDVSALMADLRAIVSNS